MATYLFTKEQTQHWLINAGFKDFELPRKGKKLVLSFPNYMPLNYGEVIKTDHNATYGGKLYKIELKRI